MKVEPAAAVTRTRIQSDRTSVPPVTAERSPPDSRMTGADSPVIADSFDRSDALDHFTVRRDDIAGFDENHVADLQLSPRHQLEILPVWAG